MQIIVGLGNPGEKYAKTRHNLGFMILDEYIKKFRVDGRWSVEQKFKSEILRANDLIFMKPQTMMNTSGFAVKALTLYYRLPVADLIVIHDDLDLKLGRVKLRQGGSAAGHHGVESIINALGSDDFIRIRVGIGNAQSHSGEQKRIHFSAEKFVLEPFMPQEQAKVKTMIKRAVAAIATYLDQGLEAAQNQYH